MPVNLSGTPTGLKAELTVAFNAMESLGVLWRGTRFHEYLKMIETELEDSSRFRVPRKTSRALMFLLWEAVTQCRQLAHTQKIWSTLNRHALRAKLAIVVKGSPHQPISGEPDASRNALLELVTAWLLHVGGFHVDITESGADVTASISGPLPMFAVECKRPAGPETLRKNFTSLRRQLARRYDDEGFVHGIAVVGIDRVVDLSSNPPGRSSFIALERDIHETLGQSCRTLQGMAPSVGFSPATTPIGAVVLLGGAFTLEPFGISTFERLGFFNLAPVTDERIAVYSASRASSVMAANE